MAMQCFQPVAMACKKGARNTCMHNSCRGGQAHTFVIFAGSSELRLCSGLSTLAAPGVKLDLESG